MQAILQGTLKICSLWKQNQSQLNLGQSHRIFNNFILDPLHVSFYDWQKILLDSKKEIIKITMTGAVTCVMPFKLSERHGDLGNIFSICSWQGSQQSFFLNLNNKYFEYKIVLKKYIRYLKLTRLTKMNKNMPSIILNVLSRLSFNLFAVSYCTLLLFWKRGDKSEVMHP